MSSTIEDYFEALERLKNNKPILLEKGTRITNDAVALEAGRNRGSIKKSRALFSNLIISIRKAAEEQVVKEDTASRKLKETRAQMTKYRRMYEDALARELSFVHEINVLKLEIRELKSKNIKQIK